jgi:cob(I)alamin adenosyltransferase
MEGQVYYPQERSGILHKERYGLIHVCYGQGVGKTSRCIGLAIRAAGAGLKVVWSQFMKGGQSGEAKILSEMPTVSYRCPGKHPFILTKGPTSMHYEHAETALYFARQAVKEGANLLICDEILNTVIFKVLQKSQILDLMDLCRGRTELVMSGADAAPEIRANADYVTEFIQRKHPYYSGHVARRGIEY